jgi:hypothetical protein
VAVWVVKDVLQIVLLGDASVKTIFVDLIMSVVRYVVEYTPGVLVTTHESDLDRGTNALWWQSLSLEQGEKVVRKVFKK